MRRFLFFALLLLVLITFGGVLTAHMLLRGDLPRRVVERAIAEQTGLRISIDSLELTWGGHTVVRGFSAALPLEPAPFVRVRELEVRHRSLAGLLLTRDPGLREVTLREPDIEIVPDVGGEWNVLRAIDLIGGRQVSNGGSVGGPVMGPLPALRIEEARIAVARPDGTLREFTGLGLVGAPNGGQAWSFAFDMEPHIDLEGRVAPFGRWQHDASFALTDLHALLTPWIDQIPLRLRAGGSWSGVVRDRTVEGRLRFDVLEVDQAQLEGELRVLISQRELSLMPRGLRLRHEEAPGVPLTVESGFIVTDGRNIRAERVHLRSGELDAMVDAQYDLEDGVGRAQGRWRGRIEELLTVTEGEVDLEVRLPVVGPRRLLGSWSAVAARGPTELAARGDLDLAGSNGYAMRGRVAAEHVRVTQDDVAIDVTGLAGYLVLDWPAWRIDRMRSEVPVAEIAGRGDLREGTWSLRAAAREWNIGALIGMAAHDPFDVDVSLAGEPREIRLTQASARGDRIALCGSAALQPQSPQWKVVFEAAVEARLENGLSSGELALRAGGDGTLTPLNVALAGTLAVSDPVIAGRALRPLDITWSGGVDAERLRVETPQLALFAGLWSAEGAFDFSTRDLSLRGRSSSVRLERLMELAQIPISYDGSISAEISVLLPELDPDRADVSGAWEATQLTGPGLDDARARGQVSLRGLEVVLDRMRVEQSPRGQIEGRAALRLDESRYVDLSLLGTNWELQRASFDIRGSVNGAAELRLDLADLHAWGTFDIRADGTMKAQGRSERFDAALRGRVDQRDVALEHFLGSLFGGQVEGSGRLRADPTDWIDSRLDLVWSEVDLSRMAQAMNLDAPVTGIMTGELIAARDEDRRAPEPLGIRLRAEIDGGGYGTIDITQLNVRGYLGRDRAIVDRARVHAADGLSSAWMRLSGHAGEPSLHIQINFEELDLDQIARQFAVTEGSMPGRVGGSLAFGLYPRTRDRLFGQGRATIRESELVGLPGFREVYRLVNLDFSRDRPTGFGEADLRLEGRSVEISRLTYFNRGTDVAARLTIHDIWAGDQSEISGVAVGAVRPLRDVRLPFAARLDRLLGALQTDVASVRIGGTLAERTETVVPFSEVSGRIMRILKASGE